MKKYFSALLFLVLLSSMKCFGQSGQWMWVTGDTLFSEIGNWGDPDIQDSSYYPPSLYLSSTWQDDSGKFWLFGGSTCLYGNSTYNYDHIWSYDPNNNFWDFVKGDNFVNSLATYGTQGVADSNNLPGGRRGAVIWKDHDNIIWMFGGENWGWIAGYNDLWRYDMSTNMWTWVKGPDEWEHQGHYGTKGVPAQNNLPRVRRNAAAWVDTNNDLWMFGGYHYNLYEGDEFYSDLWRYNIDSNVWTWMGGPKLTDQPGVYGTKGLPDTLNIPSSRSCECYWSDSDNFYLYGGDSLYPLAYVLGNVWRYNKNTKEWTWLSGTTLPSVPGVSGTLCIPDTTNFPTTRNESTCVKLNDHQMLLFGGFVKWSDGNAACARDVWIYDYKQNQWSKTWADSLTFDGQFGIQGIFDPTNDPRGKFGAISWLSNVNEFWVYGGNRCVNDCTESDLWKYTLDPNCGGIPTSSSSNNEILEAEIFPNPTQNSFRLTLNPSYQNSTLTIYNLFSEKMFSQKLSGEKEIQVNISRFAAGMYVVEVNAAAQHWVSKVVKK